MKIKTSITLAMLLLVMSMIIMSIGIISASLVLASEQEEGKQLILESEQVVNELKSAGIKTQKVESYLGQIKKALSTTDYTSVRKLNYQILIIKKNAVNSQDKIKIVEDLIIEGEQRWLDMRNTRNMIIMAQSASDREDFDTSLERSSEAETIAQVELKSINWLYVFYKYWWFIILVTIISVLTTKFMYNKLKTSNITNKINNLTSEEINIVHLMKETQEKHFNRRELSPSQFHKAMYEYQHRLVKIRREIAHLRSERIKIYSVKKEIEFLQKEEKHVYELIKKSQEDHFVKKIVGENEYNLLIDEYHERLAEIEESIAKLQYLRDQETVLNRIHYKRKSLQEGLLDKKIEKVILPEDKLKKYRQYSELKKVYEQQKEEKLSEEIEHKQEHYFDQINELNEMKKDEKTPIKTSRKSKEDMLKELKEAYDKSEGNYKEENKE